MRIRTFLTLGAGAALMYVLDPVSGQARRIELRRRLDGLRPGLPEPLDMGSSEIPPAAPVDIDGAHDGAAAWPFTNPATVGVTSR